MGKKSVKGRFSHRWNHLRKLIRGKTLMIILLQESKKALLLFRIVLFHKMRIILKLQIKSSINLFQEKQYHPHMSAFLLISFLIIIALCSLSEFFLRYALSRKFDNRKAIIRSAGYEKDEERKREKEKAEAFLKESQDVEIKSWDGVRLHAYLKKAESKKYLITLHGYRGKAEDNGILYRYISEKGYNVLIPDLRGHGKSGGKWISMGLWESDDLLRWIDYIRALDPEAKISLHGVSMGGATVMMASGENAKNISAVIEDSGYSDLYREFSVQMREIFHIPAHPMLDIVNIWCRIRLKFSFYDVKPADKVKKSSIPTLFIHGSEDTFVPLMMAEECFSAHHGEKEIWIAEGSRHASAMSDYRNEYTKRALLFLERHMK